LDLVDDDARGHARGYERFEPPGMGEEIREHVASI
jgi:hypothetical protein